MFSAALVLGSGEGESGRAWTRSEQVGFHPGEILLADAGEVQLSTTPVDRDTEFFTIYWRREALERVAAELGFAATSRWTRTVLASGPLSAELAQLRGLLGSGAGAVSIERAYRSVTAALLHRAGPSTDSAVTRPVVHPCVRRAAERVRENIADSLSLSDLASEMNLSKFYLARSFQRSLGVPPHRYRRLLRLQCARRLLERGFTVIDAALETGFVDAPHLSRAFCEWLGVSPAAWR
ncbi:MAG TPA: AraC family transcriptional regulator, partial [Polyangiaceae bacterium]